MALRTLDSLGSLAGKRVIVRADLNVPLKDGIITDDMTGMTTGVMFVMTTVGIIINPRFDRISKIFAMHEMKSNKAVRSCAGIIRS